MTIITAPTLYLNTPAFSHGQATMPLPPFANKILTMNVTARGGEGGRLLYAWTHGPDPNPTRDNPGNYMLLDNYLMTQQGIPSLPYVFDPCDCIPPDHTHLTIRHENDCCVGQETLFGLLWSYG